MIKLDDNLLKELGLDVLPKEEKAAFLRHMYETLEMRVGTRLAERMTDQQMAEFEQFINTGDEQGAFKWLEANFPNYKEVVAEEFEKLKNEVRPLAAQIVSASQQQAQAQAPAQSQPYSPQQQPQMMQQAPPQAAPMPQQQPQFQQNQNPFAQQPAAQTPMYGPAPVASPYPTAAPMNPNPMGQSPMNPMNSGNPMGPAPMPQQQPQSPYPQYQQPPQNPYGNPPQVPPTAPTDTQQQHGLAA